VCVCGGGGGGGEAALTISKALLERYGEGRQVLLSAASHVLFDSIRGDTSPRQLKKKI